MNEPLGIALEGALRRLEFGGYLYQPPRWFEQKPQPVVRPTRKILESPVREIIDAVSTAFDVSTWAILSPRRPARTSRARFAVYNLVRDRLHYSLPQIARATRRKDHTTILHGLRCVKRTLLNDPEWAARYHAAERILDGVK